MAMLSEYVVVAAGVLAAILFLQWLVVPVVYGIPLIVYWTLRRYLYWRTLFVYSYRTVLLLGALVVAASLLFIFFPRPTLALASNFWFASGVAIGTLLWFARITASKSARADIHNQLTDDIKTYVTPKGRLVILALLSRW